MSIVPNEPSGLSPSSRDSDPVPPAEGSPPIAPGDPAPDSAAPRKRRPPAHRPRGPKGDKLIRHFKIDHQLTPEHRLQYEAMLLDPRQTADSLLKWLRDQGYTDTSRAGVARHRRQFERDVKSIRRDARVAGQFAALARAEGGATALADAGQFRFEQLFIEQLFRMKKNDARAAREWLEMGKAMNALLENRREVEDQRSAATGGKKPKLLDGAAMSEKVRRILGVPLPGEPTPGMGPDGKFVGGSFPEPPRHPPRGNGQAQDRPDPSNN